MSKEKCLCDYICTYSNRNIPSGFYEKYGCYILIENNNGKAKFYLEAQSDFESTVTKISFCPFCGRELKEREDKFYTDDFLNYVKQKSQGNYIKNTINHFIKYPKGQIKFLEDYAKNYRNYYKDEAYNYEYFAETMIINVGYRCFDVNQLLQETKFKILVPRKEDN